MIKVVVGHKVKEGADIQPILRKVRQNAIQYPGFVGDENLVAEKDYSIVVLSSTWNAVENWRAWEISSIRTELYRQIEELLVENPKISIYMVVPTHW